MTKREICERLIEIRDALYSGWNDDHKPSRELCRDAAYDLRDLLLDLAAPETANPFKGMSVADIAANAEWLRTPYIKPEEEKPEAEEKHPGVLAKPGKDGEIEFCWCQKCYEQAAVVHDPFGDGENWSYCKNCGVSFRLKRGEGEK